MTNDLINGLFELAAAIFILNHCRVLYAHKCVRGVSVLSSMFFMSWGFWNLFFYPFLGQLWSFWGGVAVVIANFIYTGMLYYYHAFESDLAGGQEMHLDIDMIGDKRC